jgi:hypothetical protein
MCLAKTLGRLLAGSEILRGKKRSNDNHPL